MHGENRLSPNCDDEHSPIRLTSRGRRVLLAGLIAVASIGGYNYETLATPVAAVTAKYDCEPSGSVTVLPGETDWRAAERAKPHQDPRETLYGMEQVNKGFEPGQDHSGETFALADC